MWQGIFAFFSGILYLISLSSLTDLFWCALLPVLLFTAWKVPSYRLVCLFLSGILWAQLHAAIILQSSLSTSLERQDLQVTGKVVSLVEQTEVSKRFEFEVETLSYHGQELRSPGRIRLSWYEKDVVIKSGERWRFKVRLKRAHGMSNPGGFDYEAWLFYRQIRATGYVRVSSENELIESTSTPVVEVQRTRIRSWLNQLLANTEHGGIIKALTIGDRQDILPQEWSLFRDTGTSHLVAISGLHIGLVAGFVYILFNFIWLFFPVFSLYVPAIQASVLPVISSALLYALLAGFTIPTQRALLMLCFILLPRLAGLKIHLGEALLYTLAMVMLLEPVSVISLSFWLSFSAVFIIWYAYHGRRGEKGMWWRWGRIHFVAGFGLIPVLLLSFYQAPLLAPIANMFAVPFVGMLLVPLSLIALIVSMMSWELAQFLFKIADNLIHLLLTGLSLLNQPELILQYPVNIEPVSLIFLLLSVLLLLAPAGWAAKWTGFLFLLPVFFSKPDMPLHGHARLTLLDVGQGLSAVVQTREHVLVFDTGPGFRSGFNTGQAVVVPFLRNTGISKLDHLVISHSDNDHIGGMQSLLAKIPVGHIFTGGDVSVNGSEDCEENLGWSWDGVLFQFITPFNRDSLYKENDRSCVLHISTAGQSILLTADIEKSAEMALLKTHPELLSVDILIAPHHGSRTSSTQQFVDAVNPEFVLFPVGYKNRFSFPRSEVVERYKVIGSKLLSTANEGAIQLEAGRGILTDSLWRSRWDEHRIWHQP